MSAPTDIPATPVTGSDHDDTSPPAGWWSASPTWAKAFLAGGLALVLVLVGVIGGIALGRSTAQTYGPAEGSIDVGFLQDMVTHHGQAVEMAVWARTHTADPQVRQIAFDIESTQTSQVGRMEGWLTLWGQPLTPPSGQYMGWMGMPAAEMPGMATPEDLARMRAATGRDLDVVFLQLMLRHHQGGLSMMQAAEAQASVPAVRALAASMVASQSAEAQTMTQMLADRGAAPLPTPDAHAGMHDMPMNQGPTGSGP